MFWGRSIVRAATTKRGSIRQQCRRTVTTVERWWNDTVWRHPNRVAIAYKDKKYSFADVDRVSTHIAAALRDQWGVKLGDRVVTVTPLDPNSFAILLACAKLGAIHFPLNAEFPSTDVERDVVNHAEPKIGIYDAALRTNFPISGTLVTLDELVSESLWDARKSNTDETMTVITSEASDDDVCWLKMKAGTKAVKLTPENIQHVVSKILPSAQRPITANDSSLVLQPMCNVGAPLWAYYMWKAGGSIVLDEATREAVGLRNPTRHSHRWVNLVREHDVTNLLLFGSTINAFVTKGEIMPSVKAVHFGGMAIPKNILKEAFELFPNAHFQKSYGLMESCGPFTILSHDLLEKQSPNSCGSPVGPNDSVKILEQPDSQIGEILIKGDAVFKGYWEDEKMSKTAFTRDGYFRTGDLGCVDRDGFIYVLEKVQDVITLPDSRTVFPSDVEKALLFHKHVLEAAVVGFAHPSMLGEEIVAFVVVSDKYGKRDAKDLKSELLAHLKDSLTSHQLPTWIQIVEDLPKKNNSKVVKQMLRSNKTHLHELVESQLEEVLQTSHAGSTTKDKWSSDQLRLARRMFLHMDADNDGCITLKELKEFLGSTLATKIFEQYSTDSETLSFEEFLVFLDVAFYYEVDVLKLFELTFQSKEHNHNSMC